MAIRIALNLKDIGESATSSSLLRLLIEVSGVLLAHIDLLINQSFDFTRRAQAGEQPCLTYDALQDKVGVILLVSMRELVFDIFEIVGAKTLKWRCNPPVLSFRATRNKLYLEVLGLFRMHEPELVVAKNKDLLVVFNFGLRSIV